MKLSERFLCEVLDEPREEDMTPLDREFLKDLREQEALLLEILYKQDKWIMEHKRLEGVEQSRDEMWNELEILRPLVKLLVNKEY